MAMYKAVTIVKKLHYWILSILTGLAACSHPGLMETAAQAARLEESVRCLLDEAIAMTVVHAPDA